MTAYARQKRYREKRHAEGQCRRCELYAPTNPKTGKPYWYCTRCRRMISAQYQAQQELDWFEGACAL
jgi:hypothetical protein